MKTSEQMQHVVTQLAETHGLELSERGAYLRLDLPGYDRLVVEVIHPSLVSVAHVFEPQAGVYIADPGIVFFMGYGPWVPVEVSQRVGGYRIYALLSEELDEIVSVLPREQADLADFAEMWARNLVTQGWLSEASLTELKPALPF